MAQATIFSGPLEGYTATEGFPGQRAYLEVVVVRRGLPGDGRHLYEFVRPLGATGHWRFAGGRQTRCEACSGVYRRAEGGAEDQGCPLCGEPA